jgi:mRNA interferase HigB
MNNDIDTNIKIAYKDIMTVVGKEILTKYIKKHANARGVIEAWLKEVQKATWKDTNDIKKHYRTASFLGENKVIFNIKGNKYRLVVKVAFGQKVVLIKFIGTHAEYDRQQF